MSNFLFASLKISSQRLIQAYRFELNILLEYNGKSINSHRRILSLNGFPNTSYWLLSVQISIA